MKSKLSSSRLILVAALAITAVLQAQTQGEITGRVADTSGGVIVGAKITLTNLDTTVNRSVTTNEAGIYRFPSVYPGSYSVKAEQTGFQPAIRSQVELQIQQIARADFELPVGQTVQALEVTGGASLLDTESVSAGTVIENRRIVDLPLNGRNFLQLVSLGTNVSYGFASAGNAVARIGGDRAAQNISVSGQRAEFNNYTLDGVANTDVNYNTYVFMPSIDALQEFKVQSGIFPAEFGRATSQVNVSTKPGSNAYHGALFEFLRNDNLDARSYAFTAARVEKEPFIRNQFGFTLGGPIVLPRIYSGKNRLFFMSNYEVLRDRKTLQRRADVPIAGMRAGDFSSVTSQFAIYDPATRVRRPDGRIAADPFAGNRIPASRFNGRAQKLLAYYPLPNVPGALLSRNWLDSEVRRVDTDQFITRVDFTESDKSSWFGRYSWADEFQYSPATFLEQGTMIATGVHQAAISNTRIFGPTMVNEFRFGYSRFYNTNAQYNAFRKDVVTEIGGIPGVPLPSPSMYGIPSVSITGFTGFGDPGDSPYVNRNHTFQWVDNLSIIRGKHSMKFGAEIRRDRYNQEGNAFLRGTFSFAGTATQNPLSPARTGYGMADYMLGLTDRPRSALGIAIIQFRSTYQAYYFDETWRIHPKLTINLGLRYENAPPYRDRHEGIMNLAFSSFLIPAQHPVIVRPGTGDFYESVNFRFDPAIKIARDNRMGERLVASDNNDFAPRVGLAYTPGRSWTVRTGFGAFYAQDSANPRFDMARNLGGRRDDASNSDFPDLTLDAPFRGIGAGSIINNPAIFVNVYGRRTPYIIQYMFNVQRQFGGNFMAEAGYIGNVGHKLERIRWINLPLPGAGAVQDRRPWPELGNCQLVDSVSNSNYNALALKIQQRHSSGLSYMFNYTMSKSIDSGSGIRAHGGDEFPQDNYDISKGERGLSTFHVYQRFTGSPIWELPFGKGRRWVDRGGVPNAFVGGWQIASIFTLQAGRPLTVVSGRDVANVGGGSTQRPDATGEPVALPRGDHDSSYYFNTAAFKMPTPYNYGNVGRNTLIGPGLISWDFSAGKNFPGFREGHQLRFRLEAFNFPNRPNFGFPSSSLLSASFGRISGTATTMREIQFGLKYVF